MTEWQRAVRDLEAEGLLLVQDGNHGEYRPRPDEFSDVGAAFIRATDMNGGRLLFESAKKINEIASARVRKGIGAPQDVILSHKGTVGKVAFAPADSPPFVCSPQTTFWRSLNHSVIDPRYLYAFLRSAPFKAQLRARENESDMAAYVSLTQQRRLMIAVPPLKVQRAIAGVLGALDDKIRTNELVAHTSSALAITRGRAVVESVNGAEVRLADEVVVTKGNSYRSADLGVGHDWLVSLKCVGRDGVFKHLGLKQFSGDFKESQSLSDGDVVVAHTDLTQKAEVIARPVRVAGLGVSGRLIASLDLAVVRPCASLTREYLLALLSTSSFRDHAMGYCNGTTVLHLSVKALPEFRFAKPDRAKVDALSKWMSPLLAMSDQARAESLTLTDLRDTLLPQLMSGELRVHDAEKIVEDTV